jgi:hypothetical protein
LSEDVRAAVHERESDRDKEIRRQQNQTAEERQRIEAQWQQVQQARQAEAQQIQAYRDQYATAINGALAALEPEMAQFSNIRTREDLERLNVSNPAAAARFIAVGNRAHELLQQGFKLANQRQAEAQQINAARQAQWAQHQQHVAAQQQEANQKWAAEEEAKVLKAIPELRDPERGPALQRETQRDLVSRGFTEKEIEHHLRSGLFRDSRAQLLFHDAMQYRRAQARARNAVREPGPRPLSPGTSNGQVAPTNLDALAASGNMEQFIRARSKGRVR